MTTLGFLQHIDYNLAVESMFLQTIFIKVIEVPGTQTEMYFLYPDRFAQKGVQNRLID